MPNWCWNHLEVMCTKEHVAELQKFVEKSTKATKEEFSFEGTLPCGDREDWYNWSCENWGTKWDACDSHVNESEPQCFSVGFDTAWSPPIAWLRNIMDNYPNLEFSLEYDEPGIDLKIIIGKQHQLQNVVKLRCFMKMMKDTRLMLVNINVLNVKKIVKQLA